MEWSRLVAMVAMAAISCAAACGGLRAGVRDSIDEFARPENYRKLDAPAEALAKAVTGGLLAGMDLSNERVAAAIDSYVTAFMHAATRELGTELGPEIDKQVRAGVAGVVGELLADPVQARLDDAVARITHAAVAALGSEAARAMTADLGPAFAAMLKQQLAPAIRSMIEQLGPAVGSLVRDQLAVAFGEALDRELGPRIVSLTDKTAEAAAHGFMRGSLAELRPALSELSAYVERTTARGERDLGVAAQIAVISAFAIIVATLGVLVWVKHRAARRNHAALELVVSGISDMRDEDAVQRLVERIRDSGVRSEGGHALAGFLRDRPELRARPRSADRRS